MSIPPSTPPSTPPSIPPSARALLARSRDFRLVFSAQALSALGDWFNQFALLALVYGQTRSSFLVGLTLVSSALPALLAGPFVGRLVDRLDPRAVMVASDLARAALVLALVAGHALVWPVFVVLALLSVFDVAHGAARVAALPGLVGDAGLAGANVLFAVAFGLTATLGAALGPSAAAFLGADAAFWLNAASFALSAALVAAARLPRPTLPAPDATPLRAQLLEGYRFAWAHPIVRGVFVTGLSWAALAGAYHVLLTVYGVTVLRGGPGGIGVLYAASGLGFVTGGVIVLALVRGDAARAVKLFAWGKLAQCGVFLAFLFARELWSGAAAIFLMGVVGGLLTPYDTTLVQTHTPPRLLGRVFAARATVVEFATQLSIFAFGAALAVWNAPRALGAVFTLAAFGLALVGFAVLRSRAARARLGRREAAGA